MAHIEKMAKVEIFHGGDDNPDGDPTAPWVISITYVNAGSTEDIPGFKTMGEAVDYAFKWSKDRSMFISTPWIDFTVKREVK